MLVGGKFTVHYKQNIDMMDSSIEFLEIHPTTGQRLPAFYINSPLLGGWCKIPFKDRAQAELLLSNAQNRFSAKHPITGRLTGEWLDAWNGLRKMGAIMFKPTFYLALSFGLIALIGWVGSMILKVFK